MGGTEETTWGRMRLEPLRGELDMPILVINDSPIKQFAENEHAVGQSVLESFIRITNRITKGQRVTVFGYGACGRGIASAAFSVTVTGARGVLVAEDVERFKDGVILANAGHFPFEIEAEAIAA